MAVPVPPQQPSRPALDEQCRFVPLGPELDLSAQPLQLAALRSRGGAGRLEQPPSLRVVPLRLREAAPGERVAGELARPLPAFQTPLIGAATNVRLLILMDV